MTTWIIEPRDPLIVRDGRPFGPDPGARATSLPFPFPSTTTGGVRTRAGLKEGIFETTLIDQVKEIAVRGPLLVELSDKGEIEHWFAPAPADALIFGPSSDDEAVEGNEAKRPLECKPLVPLEFAEKPLTNLPEPLLPVGLPKSDPRKPAKAPPRFWFWASFEQWLLDPFEVKPLTATDLGHNGPRPESRMHVRIDRATQTSEEGRLFQTSGLEFIHSHPSPSFGARLGLALSVNTQAAAGVADLAQTIAPLGGERRLVHWRESSQALPACPDEVKARIVKDRACRVVLLIPAHFEQGYRPTWLLEPRCGVTPTLAAAAVPRPQVVSGWDFALDKPKPSRRLAPGGSVYFLKLNQDAGPAAVEQWVDTLWMHSISDDEQDQKDGFGLAVLGCWSGQAYVWEAA